MSAKALVDLQAEDAGLWFEAVTAPESYLQSALRAIHAEVEREAAALLADAPDVAGIVAKINGFLNCDDGWPFDDAGEWIDLRAALLSQQARIKALEEQVAKLKGHAEAMAAEIRGAYCGGNPSKALWAYRRDYPEGEI